MEAQLSPGQRLVIRSLRDWAGLTQAVFGARAGIERSKVSYIESGGMAPTATDMRGIERVFANLAPEEKSRITKFLGYVDFDAEEAAFVERLLGAPGGYAISAAPLSRADILKHQREKQELSQRALAVKAGIPRYRILMIEADETEISPDERDKIGRVLGLDKSSDAPIARAWYSEIPEYPDPEQEIKDLKKQAAELLARAAELEKGQK